MRWWRDGRERKKETKDSGSITVFLCILFLLFFSLTGVAFENVRVLSSQGYMRTAAYSAAMTVFGNYNRELFEQYGLFAYGGYDGKEAEDLAEEFQEILAENLQTAPEQRITSYGNLYRIGETESLVEQAEYLTNQEIFCEQIEAYLKSAAVGELKEELTSKVSGTSEDGAAQEKLELAKEYEEGKFDGQSNQEEGEKAGGTTAGAEGKTEDLAGGNPLETFKDMVRDGVLSLVCDASRLSDGMVEAVEQTKDTTEKQVSQKEDTGAADYLQEFLGGQTMTMGESVLERETEKLLYIAYGDRQFSSYVDDKKRTTKYGMEYLVAGKKEEKDNLSFVVNRLLGIRTLLNFACIAADAVLQEKSLATATALAGFTGMPPVIRAVQYVILLILAFEEACVDVTALLEGRAVPLVKKADSLKMKYEEICMASRTLFASKAGAYPEKGGAADITYQQYLYFMLLTVSRQELRSRSFDLIQYDLRQRYNQSFCIKTCICKSRYSISYEIPFLFDELPFLKNIDGEGNNNVRSLEVNYAYKSR